MHGEVVSPILPYQDGTQAQRQRIWHDIALVLGVIRRHGGGNDSRAGGHVHIDVGDYQRDPERMLGLIGLFRAFEDPLYRLAATPGETFTRLGDAQPLPEPQPDENGRWVWPEFGYSGQQMALSLSPLRRDYLADRPAGTDHVEARLFDGFLARQLGIGGVRARVEITRALADAALERSHTAPVSLRAGRELLQLPQPGPGRTGGCGGPGADPGPVPGGGGAGAGAGEAAVGTHPLAASC